MVKNSNTPYKNEIHRVPFSFSKDSKIFFFFAKEPLIFGDKWLENLGKQPKQGNLLFRKLGSGEF